MSKRKKQESGALADWQVCLAQKNEVLTIPSSWWKRGKRCRYTFYDGGGIVADFAPYVAAWVRRASETEPAAGEGAAGA